MEEAKTLIVNIAAWNSMAHLPQLLRSLDDQTTHEFSITVVDNASNDGAIAWLQSDRPDVTALRNFRNQGQPRAWNQAAALALTRWSEDTWPHRYLLLAVPELEFAPAAIETLIRYMDTHPEVMACGPVIYRANAVANEDGTREAERLDVVDSAGVVMRRSHRVLDRTAGPGDTFGVSGACLVLRASAVMPLLVRGELCDEDLSTRGAGFDLQWRLRKMGMPISLVPDAVVWRVRSSSPTFVDQTRDQIRMTLKNDDPTDRLIHLPWILSRDVASFALGLFRPAFWRAWAQALRGLPLTLKKRSEVSAKTKVRGREMRRWFA